MALLACIGAIGCNTKTHMRYERIEFVKIFYNGEDEDDSGQRIITFDCWSLNGNKIHTDHIYGSIENGDEQLEIVLDVPKNQLPYAERYYREPWQPQREECPQKTVLHLHDVNQIEPGVKNLGKFGKRILADVD